MIHAHSATPTGRHWRTGTAPCSRAAAGQGSELRRWSAAAAPLLASCGSCDSLKPLHNGRSGDGVARAVTPAGDGRDGQTAGASLVGGRGRALFLGERAYLHRVVLFDVAPPTNDTRLALLLGLDLLVIMVVVVGLAAVSLGRAAPIRRSQANRTRPVVLECNRSRYNSIQRMV